MKLAVFMSESSRTESTYERLEAEKLGVVLVGNGIYHATSNFNSSVLEKDGAEFFVLLEDLETRGFSTGDVDSKVKVINYDGLADLIMNDYEKLAWL